MKKMQPKKSMKKKASKRTPKFVSVTSKSYGNLLKGTKIYYEGERPSGLRDDGSISLGKHILEALKRKFGIKFRWIITTETDSIEQKYGIYRVKTSQQTLKRMGRSVWDRGRDLKNDIVANAFSIIYPEFFTQERSDAYVAGTLSRMLDGKIVSQLSSDDRDAINKFLPDYIASESLSTVNFLNAASQVKTLKELASELEEALDKAYSENWWQTYIKKNILIIQQGYISAIEKMNVTIGNTKYPDFMLVTHDNYLDILEIKKPNTSLLKYDSSRKNYYWDTEPSKALVQTENYIEFVQNHADTVRNYIRDNFSLDLKVLRPRGIILAGDTRKFTDQKERDDFRLLSLSSKNVSFVTYDELLNRLQNYISVLEEHSVKSKPPRKKKAVKKKPRKK